MKTALNCFENWMTVTIPFTHVWNEIKLKSVLLLNRIKKLIVINTCYNYKIMRKTLILMFIALVYGSAYSENVFSPDSLPGKWLYTPAMSQSLPAADEWWDDFGDPVLDSLISLGIDNNFNVAVAARRIDMARQAIRQAKSGYYPQLSLSVGWTRTRQSGNMTDVSTPIQNLDYFSAGVDMAWEIDLFGRITAQVKEKKANYQASHADYIATMNSLCAQIGETYIQLRTLQAQLQVAHENMNKQDTVLNIARARHEAGLNSGLDVAQASTVFYSTASSIPTLEAEISTMINSLALLTGVYASDLSPMLISRRPIPEYLRLISVGVPADILRRRPDIREAEYELAAAAAAAGVAKKDFLPVLTIDGSIGVAAHNGGDLFKGHSLTYTVAPKISWTIFDGFARNAALAYARENMHIASENYDLVVMTAIEETNSAMATYNGYIRTIDALEKVVEQSKRELDLSLDLYKQGLSDFLSVAQAQINLLKSADELVSAKGSAAGQLVRIYKALGGGWKNE